MDLLVHYDLMPIFTFECAIDKTCCSKFLSHLLILNRLFLLLFTVSFCIEHALRSNHAYERQKNLHFGNFSKKNREWEKFVDRTSAMTLIFNFVGSIMFINSEVEEKMDFH